MSRLPVPASGDAFPTPEALGRLLPAWPDGTQGENRNRAAGHVRLIGADDDLAAVEEWLNAKSRKSAHTLRSYRREAYRLMAWALAFRGKPISGLLVEDVSAFQLWLAAPVSHPAWDERGWVLFRGPLSANSQLQAMRVLQGLFRWLCDVGYLAGNPFRVHDAGAIAGKARKLARTKQRRFVPHALWAWLQGRLDGAADGGTGAPLARERERFVLNFLYWSGLRRFELAAARMAHVRPDADQWVLDVIGKGRDRTTMDEVLLLPPAMEALRRYRLARGLPEWPSPDEADVPLVAALDGSPIGDHYLNRIVKDLLAGFAPAAADVDPAWGAILVRASAHWLRHTLATHNAEAGVPMQTTADQLRHVSLDMTRRIYTHVEAKKRRADFERLLDYHRNGGDRTA